MVHLHVMVGRVSAPAALAMVVAAGAGAQPSMAQEPPTAAPSAPPLSMQLAVKERGWIRLKLQGGPGRVVRLAERLPDGTESVIGEVPLASPTTGRRRVLAWRCDRLTRTIVATAVGSDGAVSRTEASATTPACTRRIAIDRLDGRGRRGLTVRLVDRWTVGDVTAELCVAAPEAAFGCREVRFPVGTRTRVVRVPTSTFGRHRVQLRTAFGQRTSAKAAVGRPSGRFTLLATGDSMIQIIDSFLAQRLKPRGAKVRSDAHISTGITKPSLLNWITHARGSARSVKPDVTVMFIGANDGFDLEAPDGAEAPCCSAPWVDAYARRVTRMMRSYLRDGRGRVYWLLLPTPRGSTFQRVFRGVNAGIEKAARSFDDSEVRLLDLRRRFTPGGRFRPANRQDDGVHLNISGASIAADIIIAALRRDGYVR